ncbi:MAG: hypothetical protein KAS19_12735 [Anaerolineales bacterium]|nr:hypothetical protein [Anaerolineales bacterium]
METQTDSLTEKLAGMKARNLQNQPIEQKPIEETIPHFSDLDHWNFMSAERKVQMIEFSAMKLKFDDADVITVKNNLPLFEAFVRSAFYKRGHFKVYGARAIMEDLRWHTNAHDNSRAYKISNNITPRLSELSMEMFPALKGFFKTHGDD